MAKFKSHGIETVVWPDAHKRRVDGFPDLDSGEYRHPFSKEQLYFMFTLLLEKEFEKYLTDEQWTTLINNVEIMGPKVKYPYHMYSDKEAELLNDVRKRWIEYKKS
jgi:hypothetical protein